ncbi:MAG: tandem-95 repeat protein, partial [candidate division Zixibacteria bacterium]|nr:tandem-95 repeat protein [candidate division Zixibacteria bacterium]
TIPNADWNGSETITFTATDPGLLFASDAATFTVTAVNDAPVVAGIPDQTIAEGSTFATIALDGYVSDVDNTDAEMVWTYSGNTQLTVSIDANRVATIAIPNADWNGNETITFRATDPGLLFSSDPAVFTVTAVNDAPVVTDIPNQTIAEGSTFATVNLDSFVSDVDNTDAQMTWTYSGNTELTVSIDVNRVATITIPNADWNGSETITFTATDPGLLFASDPATFTVTTVNDAPVVADIPNQTIAEGSTFTTISLDGYVSDVDNTDAEMIWTYSGNTQLTVSIDINRVATITVPSADWNGNETITFRATDPGLLFASDPATFTVTAVNDAPVVTDIPNQTLAEGSTFATIALDGYVSDVDNTDAQMTWTYSGNNVLTVSIDINRVATITIPDINWNGSETITFTATDPGLLADSDPAVFTVTAVNNGPVVADIPDQSIAEGSVFATIALDDYVSDIDNTDAEIAWTYSGNTQLTVSIDPSRVATITIPNADWNGSEAITFTATDPGLLFASDAATFTVTPVNDAPVVADIPDQTIAEGATFTTISLDSYVSDIDNTDAQMTWTYTGNVELTVEIDVNRVATITLPSADWNGSETITFTATDPGLLFASDQATFTVTPVADAPILATIGARSVAENANLNFLVSASDADNTTPSLIAVPLPGGATFTDNGNGTGTLDWTPAFSQTGVYNVLFVASDGVLADSELVAITVNNTNRQPIADAGPDQFDLPAGQLVHLDGTGSSDPDTDPLTYSWVQVGGVSVTLSSTTSATPTFTPNALDTYLFALTVYDGIDFSLPDTVAIEVVNGAPPQAVSNFAIQRAGDELRFTWSAVTLDITGLPTTIDRYVIHRGTSAYFTPSLANEIGTTNAATTTFTDNNIGGANVVGDTLNQYFYVLQAFDAWGNSSALSNRVGEYDYQIITTPSTDYNLIAIPFTGTGITTADQLISAIGTGNVLTVNRYVASSQSFQSRFAAGFGTNFAVVPGGIYQVNAAAATTFTVVGNVPAPGSISYPIVTTATTDYNFLMVPFDRAADFGVAQDVINNMPGVLNTLNNFVAASQSYQSRFAAGFGTNFVIRAGKPYQANAAAAGTFPVQ